MNPKTGPVRVLYVIDGLFHAAGAENSLLRMVQLLPKQRFECTIATFRAGSDQAWFEQFGCPIHPQNIHPRPVRRRFCRAGRQPDSAPRGQAARPGLG